MDEATRRLEREAAEGNPQAVLRLARGYLQAGKADEALAATQDHDTPAVLAFRAELLLGIDLGQAADCAVQACLAEPGVLPDELHASLIHRLTQAAKAAADPLDEFIASFRATGLSANLTVPMHPEDVLMRNVLLSTQLARARRADPAGFRHALARAVARGATGVPPYADEPVPTRLFSAHGPDFKSGTFVSFDAGCEDRLTYFESALFEAIDDLLPEADVDYERCVAFGRGYGLAVERGAPTALLEEQVERINAARILPFPLAVHHHQPFDVLTGVEGEGPLSPEDQRLAWRFAEDLSRHPARMGNPGDTAPYARLLGCFRGGNPEPEVLDALLERCQQTYGPVGYSALERFAKRAHRENERMAARRAAKP